MTQLRGDPIAFLRRYWRRQIPYEARHAVGKALHPLVDELTLHKARRSRGVPGLGAPAVVGFFNGSSGIALSAQLASRALDILGVDHLRIDAGDLTTGSPPPSLSASAWIFYLNPPELLLLLSAWGPQRLAGPRFGYWAWELPKAPDLWTRTAVIMDGVIVPSTYVAAAMARSATPVTVSPHPLAAKDFEPFRRKHDVSSGGLFKAVCLFDFKSSIARKNPFGALAAFSQAFGDDPNARLIIKTQNAWFAPELARILRERAGSNVEIVDAVWDRPRLLSFLAEADVLLSLHRAEGFGLPLAEAMMLGTPVVATAWSGNLDFTSEDTACLVPWRMAAIDDPQRIYRHQSWAEPNIAAAAAYLRRLRSDQRYALALADRARATIARQLSPESWFDSLPEVFRTNSPLRT